MSASCPLADSEWARGKRSYKALQYMAAGIPVVADDVGVSAKVIGHGEQSSWQRMHTRLSGGVRASVGRLTAGDTSPGASAVTATDSPWA
jgi:glycosyltransferase involved in cell wall biosynthesis